MASRTRNLSRPDAAAVIVDDCYKLVRFAHNRDNGFMQ
jgi:hypothetical protein